MAEINKLPLFVRCIIQNFPFIEEDFDALTNYELTSKIVEYLNNVINTLNNVIDVENQLQESFVELQQYVEHYFDNLDVQEEINNKLDQMASNGTLTALIKAYIDPLFTEQNADIAEFKEEIRDDISDINNAVNALASGSPIPVTDISDMTDTSKVYVLTTDGKWYYYDGDSWEIGGTYQSTGIADGSIDVLKLDDLLQSNLVIDYSTAINYGDGYVGYYKDTGVLTADSSFTNYHVALTAGKIYTFTGRNISNCCALVVMDGSNNVVLTTTTGGVSGNVTTTFKCNDSGLTAYVSKQNASPELLRNNPILRELTSISNGLKYSTNIPLVKTYDGYLNATQLGGGNVKTTGSSTDGTTKFYQMCKGRTYLIHGFNYASSAGWAVISNKYEILEASSTSNIGTSWEETSITYTATQDGYILISQLNDAHAGSVTIVNYGITVQPTNILTGKKLAVTGDSICAGAGYAGGYAGIIALDNNMTVQNIAVGGGTITSGTQSSGVDRFWINESITSLDSDADYVLIEGGLNDAGLSVTMGSLTTGYGSSFDTDTYIGAFENMCYQLTKRFKGKKYGYVFVHQCFAKFRHSNADDGTSYYWEAKKVLEKWCIPYIDLNIECPPFGYFNQSTADLYALRTEYTKDGDGTHPNEAGYKKYYVDKITAFLKSL